MFVQISAIIVPPAKTAPEPFERFLQAQALPAADRAALTRITRSIDQSLLKGAEPGSGQLYYLWRAELDLMTDQGTVAPTLADEVWSALQAELATQQAVLTAPLTKLEPGRPG